MRVYCLDTNAMLDLCYRVYPKHIFINLWEVLPRMVLLHQISFVVSCDIDAEVRNKITLFGYDMAVFDNFMTDCRIQVTDEYQAQLAQLKADLAQSTSIPNPRTLDRLNNDLSNVCVGLLQRAMVITSEQGFNRSLSQVTRVNELKIPDTCRHFGVECGNWLPLFEHIGYQG